MNHSIFKLCFRNKKSVLSLLIIVLLGIGISGCQGGAFPASLTEVVGMLVSATPSETPAVPSETAVEAYLSPVAPDTATPEPPTEAPPTETSTITTTPTLEPIGTIIATIFPQGSATAAATATRTRRPSATPTITPTPTPPFAHLHITRPGLFSKITSPYQIEAMIQPGDDGLVRIELVGEVGNLIINTALDYKDYLNRRFWIAPSLEFEIPGAAETARLVMSVEDTFGRKIAISSVDLVLLSLGRNETTPSVVDLEPYLIRYPDSDQIIYGGTLWVSGLARRVNENPLILELIDEQGRVVGSNQVDVSPPNEELSHIPFGVEINYDVQETTPVRLTIRQESAERIPGTIALSSLEIILAP